MLLYEAGGDSGVNWRNLASRDGGLESVLPSASRPGILRQFPPPRGPLFIENISTGLAAVSLFDNEHYSCSRFVCRSIFGVFLCENLVGQVQSGVWA
jgi:hypothetical protein